MPDPFTQVQDALWAKLVAASEFTDIVNLMNRIDVGSTDLDPYKRNIQDADLPEVTVEPAGCEIDLHATMSGVEAQQRFLIVGTTGDLRTQKILFPLKWALMKIFLAADIAFLGLSFVKRIEILEVTESTADSEILRGIRGWSVALGLDVYMQWDRSDLALS